MAANTVNTPTETLSSGPKQARIVLPMLIVVSAVANLPPDKAATLSAADQKVSGQQAANSEALHTCKTAAALSKRAIKDSDPDNHQQLLELLGL